MEDRSSLTVLVAEDDLEDRFFVNEAFGHLGDTYRLSFVDNGEELLDYLHRRGKFSDPELAPSPAFVLLDLNMPKKDGRAALTEIKSAPNLTEIPVIVFTTSNEKEDREFCRKARADQYVVKPPGYWELIETLRRVAKRWPGRTWRVRIPITHLARASWGLDAPLTTH
jgi:CheY-like chemotaxis protein